MSFRTAPLLLVSAALVVPALADVVVPKGTVVAVVLNTAVSSKTGKAGDKFQLQIAEAQAGFPAGTLFLGTLTQVVPKTASAPGMVEGQITTAVLPNKSQVAVKAVPCTEKGEVRTIVKGKAPSERKKTELEKLGAIAAILVAPTPEGANLQAGSEAALKRLGKPEDVDAKPGKKFHIYLQQDVTLK